MNVPLLFYEGTGRAPERLGLAHPSICPYGAFATSDGALVLISIQNEREWVEFCARFLDEPDLPQREGFQTNVIRVANRAQVDAHIAAAFARLSRDEAARKLQRGQHGLWLRQRRGGVLAPSGVAAGAGGRRRTDRYRLPPPPVLFSDGARPLGPVPALGEHSAAIRAEFAA